MHRIKSGHRGFSLAELLVAMAVGLIVFSGVIGLLIASDETVSDTVQRGEMQENGRLAMALLSKDVMMAGYWGNFTGMDIHEAAGADIRAIRLNQVNGNKVAVQGADCLGEGENNGSFFVENSDFFFRFLWGTHTTFNQIFNGCIVDAVVGSDVLQVKRVLGSTTEQGNEKDTRYYLISTDNQGIIYAGSDATPDIESADINEYLHHIYYIAEEMRGGLLVPVLKRKYLYKTANSTGNQGQLKTYNLVEGVEKLGFLYGIDTDGDATVNYYAKANELDREDWEQERSTIMSVRIHILVRALEQDLSIDNTNIYDLGSYTYQANDNYRRTLFTTTVKIVNAGKEVWRN
ncbi:prepilin-type cleavage/methylation-like protein [Catenovulum agarivorans DS-2]|uniref:Prepilin-type cleavage/methylation-like protein n=1 Tax=Catenovulum agarivorans DS-2 TaxID=1328313 RepID=W7QLK2_9ALTE|nr:PilW family protein [Catenovulum agarivorans]EWH09008.1 prepilin-type cleavage/methylation-like protein [Catenovulum agarivorans DS-2]